MILRDAIRDRRGDERASSSRKGGFTLMELLAVIVIVVLLATALAASPGLWRSKSITTAGNQVMEDLALARELAVAGNQPTEMWFLQPTGGTLFTGTQIYTIDQNGIWSSYGGVHHLPANVGIDSGATLSSLFAPANNTQKSWTSQAQTAIPGYGLNYIAYAIRFMPDGSIAQATQNYFITLHDVALGNQLSTLPANYVVLNIDYVTGAVSMYRP